jgi:hypothetical protein
MCTLRAMVLFPIVFLWIGVLVWASWKRPVERETPPEESGGGPWFRRKPSGSEGGSGPDRGGRGSRQRLRERRSVRAGQPR